jgi:uncharacterized protein
MQRSEDRILCSASDLVGYLECEHLTTLDRVQLDTPLDRAEDDPQAKLIQKKGLEHESGYLAQQRARGLHIVEIDPKLAPEARAEATREAMRACAPARTSSSRRPSFRRRCSGSRTSCAGCRSLRAWATTATR